MTVPLSFDNPIALLLLPVVAGALWALSRRSAAPLDRQQIAQSLVVRLFLAFLIVCAIAQPHWRVRTNRLTVMFLIDHSASIRPDQRGAQNRYVTRAIAAKGRDDRAGVVVFGRYANVETRPDADVDYSGVHAEVNGDATDISAALKTAAAAFPSDTGKKIVLLTDGRENSGSALDQIADLRRHGILVDIAPVALDESKSPEVSIESIKLPSHAQKDAPFLARVIVRSNVAQRATVDLSRDGAGYASRKVDLPVGLTQVAFTVRESSEGVHRYDAVLTARLDTIQQNNQAMGCVSVRGVPRVLYVASARGQGPESARSALAAQGIEMVVRSPSSAPTGVADWQAFDSVVLDDVASTEFSPGQLESLRVSVHDFGVGLGMVGGPESFGAGMYAGTPVEAALPVNMRVPRRKNNPEAAVVIVLDASGSMSVEEHGVEKVQLAAQAAVNLMRGLDPDDRVCVIAVTETPKTVVPLQRASEAVSAQQDIEGLRAGGGGINCHTGLVAAYQVLEQTRVPIRHVIMCADTTDSDEQEGCADLARSEYETNHITTSMLGIGLPSDPHVPFQKTVAAAGHGRMEAVSELSKLPATFDRDVGYLKGSLFIEKPFRPIAAGSDPVLAGVSLTDAPPLLGYNLSMPKNGADVPVRTAGDGDVVLAHWRYGAGRTFAFTSDDRPHWASKWLAWSGYGRFWAQLVRWSLKNEMAGGLQTSIEAEGGRGRIAVDALTDKGDYLDGAHLTATVASPNGATRDVKLEQSAAGRYDATFDAADTGLYTVHVRDNDRTATGETVALAVPYSPEYQNVPPNADLLRQISRATGGRFGPDPKTVFHNTRLWDVGDDPLMPSCLLLAALVLLLDIAWRRLAWKLTMPSFTASPPDGRLSDGSPVRRMTLFGAIQIPKARQTTERTDVGADEEYLTRSASTRIGTDDDPFPFVVTKDAKR
ncbi:MAG: VWA domain-containing protein [Capsulimonadaceae bacterium]|nr:VWA domain-containing protein [Capsulimonadaceae bacterium]